MTSSVTHQYAWRISVILGIVQLICGSVSIVAHISGFTITYEQRQLVDESWLVIGYGIWCGIMFLFGGGFAVGAGTVRSRELIISNLSVAMVACAFALIQILCALATVIVTSMTSASENGTAQPDLDLYAERQKGVLAIGCLLLTLGVLELIAAAWCVALVTKVFCR